LKAKVGEGEGGGVSPSHDRLLTFSPKSALCSGYKE
jgi:hypothetical protein